VAEAVDRMLEVLANVAGIHQVEKLVMKNLQWTDDPLLSPLGHCHDAVTAARAACKQRLDQEAAVLARYVGLYACYDQVLNLKLQDYLDHCCFPQIEAAGEGATLASLLAAGEEVLLDPSSVGQKLAEHKAAVEALDTDLPSKKMNLGLFLVDVAPVKAALLKVHQEVIDGLFGRLKGAIELASQAAVKKYSEVTAKLQHDPATVEEVAELEQLIKDLPVKMAAFETEAKDVEEHWQVLDEHRKPGSPKEVHLRYELAYSLPIQIWDKVEALNLTLPNKRGEFMDEMHGEQEQFQAVLADTFAEVDSLVGYTDPGKIKQTMLHLRSLQEKLKDCQEKSMVFMSRQTIFGESVTDYDVLNAAQKNISPYFDLWTCVEKWTKYRDEWMTTSLSNLDAEAIDKEANTMFKTLVKVCRTFENQGGSMAGQLRVGNQMRDEVNEFRPVLPLLIALRTPGMEDRHWEALSEKVGRKVYPDKAFTLTSAKQMGLHDQVDAITKVAETAAKENAIKVQLDKMEEAWADVMLEIVDYRETGTAILSGVDTYIALLDEQVTLTQAMTFSAFKGPFADRIDKWNEALQNTSEVIDEWLKVQRNWMYLQPIFESPDINKQLPMEGKRFTAVDKHWRAMIKAAKKKSKAIEFCNDSKLLAKLQESNNLLDMVSKGLSDYLEAKRAGYSRFYFLADEELLEILSETKDPLAVQPHLRKCFEALDEVQFEVDLTITAMKSPEKEVIKFVTPVDPKGKNIETWMGLLTTQMRVSVREQMLLGVRDYFEISRTDWMQKWPGMVVINGSQVHWTRETELAMLEKGNAGVRDYYDQLVQQLNDMVFLIRGSMSKLARKSVGALAVVDVHARDVMLKMAESGVSLPTDFDWISQMRYYWKTGTVDSSDAPADDGDLKVVMVSSEQSYGYEYLGNSMRLVITPLTDKCYLTIMGALQMILGGAPAGPAGTGKTETTKDLAKALAKQCVVFNCSDQLDYRAMGKFFKGLASSGAWACFDEFNRISIEVLSVIAQQVMTLQGAVQRGEKRVIFEDVDIYVDPNFSVYITM
jgi:dynein heavy chain